MARGKQRLLRQSATNSTTLAFAPFMSTNAVRMYPETLMRRRIWTRSANLPGITNTGMLGQMDETRPGENVNSLACRRARFLVVRTPASAASVSPSPEERAAQRRSAVGGADPQPRTADAAQSAVRRSLCLRADPSPTQVTTRLVGFLKNSLMLMKTYRNSSL